MIEEIKIKKLYQRILNQDFKFTSEDKSLIRNNDTLQLELIKQIDKMYPNVINRNLNELIVEDDIIDAIHLCDESILSTSYNVLVMYSILECKNYFIDYIDLKDFLNNYIESNNDKQILLNYYFSVLKNNSFEQLAINSIDTLKLLLELKRYDLIEQATVNLKLYDDDFSEDLLNQLKENNLHLNLNKDLLHHEKYYELFSFDSLLTLICGLESVSKNILAQLDKYISGEIAIGKINLNQFEMYHPLDHICSKLPSDYREKIQQLIIKNIDIIDCTSNCEVDFDDYVIDYLIEHNRIDIASHISGFINHKFQEKAVRLINENPNYYLDKTIKVDSLDLLECCIRNKIKINAIYFSPDFRTVSHVELSHLIYKLIKENVNIEDYKFPKFKPNNDLLNFCLKNKFFNLIESFSWRNIINSLNEEQIDLLDDVLKDNLNLAYYIFDKINLGKMLNVLNLKLLKSYLSLSKIYLEQIIDYIEHNQDITFRSESLEIIFSKMLEYTDLNKEHLKKLKERFGFDILLYLENENIQKLINLDDLSFNKILNLFPTDLYTITDLENAYDSVKQHEFGLKYSEDLMIFNKILNSLQNKDNNYLIELTKIQSVMDEKFYDYLYRKYEYLENKEKNSEELLLSIIDKIKNGNYEQSNSYKEILHTITTYYLDRKRGEYRKTYDMYADILLDYDLEPASLKNAFLNYYIENFGHILIKIMVQNGFEYQLALEIINYYIYHKFHKNSQYSEKMITSNVGQMIKFAKQGMNEYISSRTEKELIIIKRELDYHNKVKKNYKVSNNFNNVFKILTELNIDLIKNHLLGENSDIYEALVKLIKKNKVHMLPNEFLEYLKLNLNNLDIDYNYQDFAGFINYFYKIYDKYKRTNTGNGEQNKTIDMNLSDILINSSTYSSMSSISSLILGNKDFELIKSNPGPNAARQITTNERIKESVERTFKNFERSIVKIPTFNETVNIENDKKMQVIIGNFTHPSNLTHGERTGACMRVGGAGNSLYEFCLDNPYGFHIRFEDPKTKEYISRVSGFRNGNTVFLNELRDSCNKDLYSNVDVVSACKKVANLLIEKSKDSESPIENVVISNEYAMKSVNYEIGNLNVSNIKEGFKSFYTDVNSYCVVLATTAKNSHFVPINFDNSKIPDYLPAREKIVETTNKKEVSENINRIHLIKQKLLGEMYEYEGIIFVDDLLYCLYNQDWYIYVDSNFKIYEELINVDIRAKEEFEIARKKVQEFIDSNLKLDECEVKYAI